MLAIVFFFIKNISIPNLIKPLKTLGPIIFCGKVPTSNRAFLEPEINKSCGMEQLNCKIFEFLLWPVNIPEDSEFLF